MIQIEAMIALGGHKFVRLSAISYSAEEQIGYAMSSGVDAAYRVTDLFA